MLLEFRAKNFRSFQNELVFSMIPAPKQKGLDYSILTETIAQKKYKGLSSAVIYGPNASGKTNIIMAMDAFKSIVLRGHIKNADRNTGINPAANFLELIPNRFASKEIPVEFGIKFISQELLFEYSISLELGEFLDEEHDRKILFESLSVNEKMIFTRKDSIKFGDLTTVKKLGVKGFEENQSSLLDVAKNNLNPKELFLMSGFKTMFSSVIAGLINNWFDEKFLIFCRADALQILPSSTKRSMDEINGPLQEAVPLFGVNSNKVRYMKTEDDAEPKLTSILLNDSGGALVPADLYESYGTIRFINMFPAILMVLINGGTLVVDEFDASLHPMALMSIVNVFHNDELNKKKAQLIFNTHNPIFLNSSLFRRDEIKFVERDEDTYSSSHYSLSDFGTAGKVGVRQRGEYMKNYFVNQYGAIQNVDFTPLFERIWEAREGDTISEN